MGWFLHAGFVEAGRGASCPFARLETTLAHQAATALIGIMQPMRSGDETGIDAVVDVERFG